MTKPSKPVGPPRGRRAVANRRERVAALIAKGFSQAQIARSLKVSRTTIEADVAIIRPILREALKETGEDLYVDAVAELNEVRRELWLDFQRLARDPEKIGLRSSILSLIASLPDRRARLGQSLGLLVEAPERKEIILQAQRAMADVLMQVPSEEATKIARKYIDGLAPK